MMRIIMENGGIDVEQLINNDSSSQINRQTNDIFRQYLKNKENELLSEGSNAGGS